MYRPALNEQQIRTLALLGGIFPEASMEEKKYVLWRMEGYAQGRTEGYAQAKAELVSGLTKKDEEKERNSQ